MTKAYCDRCREEIQDRKDYHDRKYHLGERVARSSRISYNDKDLCESCMDALEEWLDNR